MCCAHNPRHTASTVKHSSSITMVWGCFENGGCSHVMEEWMELNKEEKDVDDLEHHLLGQCPLTYSHNGWLRSDRKSCLRIAQSKSIS